ncbi:MAG: hypothetical protein IJP80_02625 [Bacteroidales bacterium]|nr:hypothetical protein [Bacteroidales bacterium]
MPDILQGSLRRYHIEAVVDSNPVGTTYRAFARRKAGEGIVRRYFAIVEKTEGASQTDFDDAIRETVLTSPFQIHKEETITYGGRSYVVMAKGEAAGGANPVWGKLQNRGYLMLFLSAFILILMIVRLFQSPAEERPIVPDDEHAVESVDL